MSTVINYFVVKVSVQACSVSLVRRVGFEWTLGMEGRERVDVGQMEWSPGILDLSPLGGEELPGV